MTNIEIPIMNEMRMALAFFEKQFMENYDPLLVDQETPSYDACAGIALRRIIPQKPIDKSQKHTDWHIMCCPTCGRTFWNSGEFIHYQPHHCDNCGQAIDWSEVRDI